MSEIFDVEIGYVSTRRGARLHLVVSGGRSYCKSGTGVIRSSRKARGDDAPHVCRKCREALRTRLVDVLNIRGRRAYGDLRFVPENTAIIRAAESLIEGMMTDRERAERDETLAEIGRRLAAKNEAETTPKPIHMVTSPESDDQLTLF